jgi:uncharacterized protein (DUF433 family)
MMSSIATTMTPSNTYRGATHVQISKDLSEVHGTIIRTAKFAPPIEQTPTAQITVDPEVRGGVPCVGESRRPIAHILERLASGMTEGGVLDYYPGLTLADIQLALEVAAWVMRDPGINWSELNLPEMVDLQRELRDWQSLSDDTLGEAENSSGV